MSRRKYNTYEINGSETTLICYRKGQKYQVIIDTEDLEKVLDPKYGVWYVRSCKHIECKLVGTNKSAQLHRVIVDAPKGSIVDHIDGNPLRNVKSNLRIVDKRINARNRNNKINSNNTSGYRGVWFEPSRNKWVVQITSNGVTKHIGRYSSKEEAIQARLDAENKYWGKEM